MNDTNHLPPARNDHNGKNQRYWRLAARISMAVAIVSIMIAVFCFLDGGLLNKTNINKAAIYIPPDLLANFFETISADTNKGYTLLLQAVFNALMIFLLLGFGYKICQWLKKLGVDNKIENLSLIISLNIVWVGMFYLQDYQTIWQPDRTESIRTFINAAESGDYAKTVQLLTMHKRQDTPSGALLLTQIAMRNSMDLPAERYEQARKDLLLAVPAGSFAEGQLAYVLEHHLHGKAVSEPAKNYLRVVEAEGAKTIRFAWYSVLLSLVTVAVFVFCDKHIALPKSFQGEVA